jgi:tetratricopeptide (TPR) repeat protein
MRRHLVVSFAMAWAATAAASGIGANWVKNPDYQTCFKSARDNPKEGHRFASFWRDNGGGPPAEHCHALAMLGLGYYQEAAQRFELLAERFVAEDPALAVELHGQAASAWSLAAKPERAHAAQSAAIKLRPDDVDLLIDRSVTQVTVGAFWDAVDDLNRAIDLAPTRADVLALRASAYRRLETLDLAEDDIARALALDPHHPDALLERGILRRLKGEA